MAMQASKPSFLVQVILLGLCVGFYLQTAPAVVQGHIRWIPAFFAVLAGLLGVQLVTQCFLLLARYAEWLSSHQSSGKSGSAKWATVKEIKPELNAKQDGPFWGVMK